LIGKRELITRRKPEREKSMSERLAVGIIPGTGWRATEIQEVAQAAEEAGFEAIFVPRSTMPRWGQLN
jgi:alkanesulfonate monooxygenase SsuD/methylene tetrahydromethanopterin reductase-like flavin-dependent oxidoreductase (luciferase family)